MTQPYISDADKAERAAILAKYTPQDIFDAEAEMMEDGVTDVAVTAPETVTPYAPLTSTVTGVTAVTDFGGYEGAATLDALHEFLGRFIAYPTPESADAHALWIVHAHLVEEFENTPRIAFLSPEPGSGKSRSMELTEALVPRPVLSVNVSPSYIFRKISDEAGLPTLLIDECDAIFTGGKNDSSEELRGLLNSGYRRGATAGRVSIKGKELVAEEWPSFAAVALAGLNTLPDTIMTRSVVIRMKRRRKDQKVEAYRRRIIGPDAELIRERVAQWADSIRQHIGTKYPPLPNAIQDRDADVWEPLIGIADEAGGTWPERSRAAALALLEAAKDREASLGIRLLSDIRTVFTEDRITSIDLVMRLVQMEDAPWASLKGEELSARYMAFLLSKYEIAPKPVRINGRVQKGYQKSWFEDSWARYLPEMPTGLPSAENR
ncbi:DUF3631 domain-containing protein [Brachybacterium muris]|uniref:DUF3631 domain-containing protein n=1 Tax=Brachybacterium muris TaxID=219301 RepID=UPI00223B9D50|nr:DUF3631 domain-containing protein [Brachybacterium muris]MCT1653663.1 DUF3631 domain-containing protein [Brachybacterium muris]